MHFRILGFFLTSNKILFISAILFIGCATNQPNQPNPSFSVDSQIRDLNLSQRAIMYISDNNDFADATFSQNLKTEYLKKYFSVWDDDFIPPSKDEMFWGLASKKGFGESKKELQSGFLDELESNMQVDSYPSRRDKAIMVKSADVRVLPTNKPRFSSIDGYPFDRWQNSMIFAFTPVIILHQDKTKEWILIQSSFVSGWVKHDEVALISQQDAASFMENDDFLIPNRDKIPLYFNNQFIENARIGMLFETKENNIYGYYRDDKGLAVKIPIAFDKNDFDVFPLNLNQINIANVADSLNLENYGWGGMYGNRDCSSFVRDVFMNLGIWLPRNSMAQVNYAKNSNYSQYIELPNDNEKKIEIIKKYAKPFRTIFWLKGHIMLYIGETNGQIMAIHDVWGANTSQGVQILGGISITTLTPGIEKNDKNNAPPTLLDRIQSMNIIIK